MSPQPATLLAESKAARSAHPSAGMTPKPPTITVQESKTETRRRGDSVAQSTKYVPSQSRGETNRDTLRPAERDTRRGDFTMNSMVSKQSKYDNMSTRDSKTPHTERALESSTKQATKAGSMIGSDAVSSSTATAKNATTTRRDRTAKFPTIYEDEEVSRYDEGALVPYNATRAPASRFESVKSGHLVPSDYKHSTKGGSRVNGNERAMIQRDDRTITGLMREEAGRASTVGMHAMQIKVDTGDAKIEIGILEVTKKR